MTAADTGATRRSLRPRPHTTHRTDIQGLRALAVGTVLLAHAGVPGFAGGFIGVDVFFVISGFLITSLLLREVDRSGTISIRSFYERRARRILPAGTIVILAVVAYAAIALPTSRMNAIGWDAIWSALFVANINFAITGTDYFAATTASPLQHFWSLAVEEQFYLVWPLLVLAVVFLTRKRAKAGATRLLVLVVTVIIALSLTVSVIETSLAPATAYFSTIDRGYELAGGALLAIVTAAGTRLPVWMSGPIRALLGWAGLIGIIVMAMVWDERTPIPGFNALFVVLATCAILASGIGDIRGAGRLLSFRPVRYMGDISYSLYLWHWPLLTLGLLADWDRLPRTLVLVAAAFVLASLSYHFIEQPFQRKRVRLPKRTGALILWPVTAVVVVAVAVSGIVRADHIETQTQAAAEQWYDENPVATAPPTLAPTDEPGPDPLVVLDETLRKALADADAGAPIPPTIDYDAHQKDVFQEPYPCVAWWEQTAAKICPQGDTTSERTVVLVGDSHAGQWIASLDELGKAYGFKVVPLIKPACNVYDVEQFFSQMPVEACDAFKVWAREQAAELKPELIITAARGFDGMHSSGEERDELWRTGAESGISDLVAIAPRVVVLSDVPVRSSKAADCLTGVGATLAGCIATEDGPETDSNVLTKAAAEAAGAEWVDTSPLTCVEGRCPLVVEGTVVYYDDNHITVSWARWVADPFGRLVGLARTE